MCYHCVQFAQFKDMLTSGVLSASSIDSAEMPKIDEPDQEEEDEEEEGEAEDAEGESEGEWEDEEDEERPRTFFDADEVRLPLPLPATPCMSIQVPDLVDPVDFAPVVQWYQVLPDITRRCAALLTTIVSAMLAIYLQEHVCPSSIPPFITCCTAKAQCRGRSRR